MHVSFSGSSLSPPFFFCVHQMAHAAGTSLLLLLLREQVCRRVDEMMHLWTSPWGALCAYSRAFVLI